MKTSKELKLILNFSNEYLKVGMKNQRFPAKFSRLAVYEKFSVFQSIIRFFFEKNVWAIVF